MANLVAPTRPPEAVRLVVHRLRERVRGGIHLVRYDGGGLHIIDADPDFPPRSVPGSSERLRESAMGKLLLVERAGRDPVEERAVELDLDLVSLVSEVRDLGYARQVGAVTVGFGCIAVPIRDRSGSLVAGLCISAPLGRIEDPVDLLDLLQTGALDLAPLLA